jgi:translation initiation factor IF-3
MRYIDSEVSQVGIIKTNEELSMAQVKTLDIAEISPQTNPPFVR